MYDLNKTKIGYMFDNPTLNGYLNNYLNTYPDLYKIDEHIYGILGRDKVEKDIPRFGWVLQRGDNYIVDLTTLYDGKLNKGVTYQQLVAGSIFSREYRDSENVPTLLKTTMIDIYVDMITKTLTKEFLLGSEVINGLRAILYFHYFIGVLEVDNEEAYRYTDNKKVIIDEKLKEYMANYEYDGLDSLIDSLRHLNKLYNETRFQNLTAVELSVLIGRGWVSKDGNLTVVVALEHLPTMFALAYVADKYSLYQRSNIYSILKNGKYSLNGYFKRASSLLEL